MAFSRVKKIERKTVSYDQNINMVCLNTLYFLPLLQFTTPCTTCIFILCIVSLGIKPTSLIMTRGLQVLFVAVLSVAGFTVVWVHYLFELSCALFC